MTLSPNPRFAAKSVIFRLGSAYRNAIDARGQASPGDGVLPFASAGCWMDVEQRVLQAAISLLRIHSELRTAPTERCIDINRDISEWASCVQRNAP
jgi:hypothetical protein